MIKIGTLGETCEVKKNAKKFGLGSGPVKAAATGLFLAERCHYSRIYPARVKRRKAEHQQFFPASPTLKMSTWKGPRQIPVNPNSVKQPC